MNFNDVILGFELDFVTGVDTKQLVKLIKKYTDTKVCIYNDASPDYFLKKRNLLHDGNIVVLHYQLPNSITNIKTPPLKTAKAFELLVQIMALIQDNGRTTEMCNMFVNLSFSPSHGIDHMRTIDILKYIVEFNESKIYEKFPNRSPYARSIKHIIPIEYPNGATTHDNIKMAKFILPSDSKYYAIDFSKSQNNYLKFKYFGGVGYEKKVKPLIDFIEYIISFTDNHLQRNSEPYSYNTLDSLVKLNVSYRKIYDACGDYEKFKEKFKGINMFVDLRAGGGRVKGQMVLLQDKLSRLLMLSKVRSGTINYDSTFGVFEIKGAKSDRVGVIENVNLIGCTIKNSMIRSSNITNCTLINCIIVNSNVYQSNLNMCGVEDSIMHSKCKIESSQIGGDFTMIYCEVKKSIINNASLRGKYSIDKDTIIINLTKNITQVYHDPRRLY